MRARAETFDDADTILSEDTLLNARVSTVTEVEYIEPIAADTEPTSETVDITSNVIVEADGGLDPLYGTGVLLGGTISILGDITYTDPMVADPDPADETLYGTAGNDTIDGGEGNDAIYGYAGDDLLRGGAGHDRLYGMNGNDRLEGGDGDDILTGSYDGDTVLFGDAGNDLLLGGNGIDHLYGGEGNDLIFSYGGIDYADGGTGDDKVIGGAGHDMLWGGAGNDDLDGFDGFDTLYGGDGNDTLHGRSHADTLFGGAGDDALYGDGLYGSHIYGPAGPDAIEGADVLFGEDGNDLLYGAGGDDQLFGGYGGDILGGGNGDDVINGGAGADRMRGDAGRDTFVFTESEYQGHHAARDTIVDFNGNPFSGDRIDLRALFDKYTNFTGTTADQAWGQGYLYFVEHGEPGEAGFGTTVYIDPNGKAPDEPTYYGGPYDIAVVDLEGVSRNQLSTFDGSAYGYASNFLV